MAQGLKIWLKEGAADIRERYSSAALDWIGKMKNARQKKSVLEMAAGMRDLAAFVFCHALAIFMLCIAIHSIFSPASESGLDSSKATGGIGSAIGARLFR